MKLNVSFARLIRARESIGAAPANVQIRPPSTTDRKNPFEIALLEEGHVVLSGADLDDVRYPAGLAAIGNQQITLHIKQPHCGLDVLLADPVTKPKYHLCDCRTLEDMRRKKRFDRYVATRGGQEGFTVQPKDMRTRQFGKEIKAKLQPCQNCLTQLDIPFEGFDLQEFFAINASIFRCLPLYSSTNYPGDGYSKDWPRISRQYRERAGWRCTKCQVDLSRRREDKGLLHVHHVNGVTGDNRPGNLVVLCALCHSQEPSHGHMKIKDTERRRIEDLRRNPP